MIKIEKAFLDENDIRELCDLSKRWVDEDISWGMVPNTKENITEPVIVARDNDTIVGYSFGSFYLMEKKTSGIPNKSKCFSVDELYVLPEYRNIGLGKKLYDALIDEIKEEADYITLSTSTKDYKRILRFYCEINQMDFHDAFLFKKIDK